MKRLRDAWGAYLDEWGSPFLWVFVAIVVIAGAAWFFGSQPTCPS